MILKWSGRNAVAVSSTQAQAGFLASRTWEGLSAICGCPWVYPGKLPDSTHDNAIYGILWYGSSIGKVHVKRTQEVELEKRKLHFELVFQHFNIPSSRA